MTDRRHNARDVFPPTGTELNTKSWLTEAPLRMLMNNLHPDVAENPHELVVYGGIGRKVLNRGQLAWDTRTRISTPEKAAHIVVAFFEALWNRPAPPTEPILWSRHDFRPVAGW